MTSRVVDSIVVVAEEAVREGRAGDADRGGRDQAPHAARAVARHAVGDRALDEVAHGTRRTRPPMPLKRPATSAPTPASSRPMSPKSDRSITTRLPRPPAPLSGPADLSPQMDDDQARGPGVASPHGTTAAPRRHHGGPALPDAREARVDRRRRVDRGR